jgi:hypothetical protein
MKPRHDDAAARIDHTGIACVEVRTDGGDFLAFDQHVRLDEVTHLRVHRHHRTAANDVAPPRTAAVLGRIGGGGRTRRKQMKTCGRDPDRSR